MTCLRVTIRKPPKCARCGGSGIDPDSRVFLMQHWAACGRCLGLSAHVEYFFEYGPLTHTKAYWEVWDDDSPNPEPARPGGR